MSSPLSMLKKTKRGPLQGVHSDQWRKDKVPFRRNLLKEFQTAVVNSNDSSDSNSSQLHRTPASDTVTSLPIGPFKNGAPPSDFELMSAMMQRVTLLEIKVTNQTQELQSKNKKISMLEEKLRVQRDSASTRDLSGRDDVEKRCQQLQNQVHEMESFLSDYGLIWVGDERSSDSDKCEETHSSGTSEGRDFHMNFDLVLQRIKDMNIVAGEGETFVQSTPTGAQLARKDPVQLRLYSNGIVMFDGPFRSYQENSTQQFMRDLMDGYFPSELQERFPDGVPFEVHDRRDEEFILRLPWNTFPGEGQTVCGKKDESSNVTGHQTPGRKLTMDQFMNRMPKMVVKAGQVIDIRESLRTNLQGSPAAPSSDLMILVDTAALQAMKQRLQTFSSDRPPSARNIVTLKVKSEDGNQTYILKMCFSETIGHLRQYLDKHRGGGPADYDIISAHPQFCYEDESRALQSYGLTTNAHLLLRKRQHSQSLEVK
ncbi:hypothetical protein JOB18_032895 [Solea senegalensis]|uniref:UBX domain-containing protein 11 n=2 Tax=Solea senegalensis TaxID=28829 RepID=A0AAV6PUF9_SOLSE|nr:UBX domain-containing protein 11 [Solea senegalensis]KAG7475518.1 hypothetical protein JOB18_032895 [Solea senegalensis]